MSDNNDLDSTPTNTASSGNFVSEDWLATIVGLAILALALLGLIPKAALW